MVVFSGFSYVTYGCVLFSKIELFLVWVCLSTFLCFIISFVDFNPVEMELYTYTKLTNAND